MKIEKKHIKLAIGAVIVIAMLALVLDIPLLSRPADAIITSRQCDFVSWDQFQGAVCDDGTLWEVVPLQPTGK